MQKKKVTIFLSKNILEKVIALYQYESRSDGDLSFQKGDVMILMDNSYVLICFFLIKIEFRFVLF